MMYSTLGTTKTMMRSTLKFVMTLTVFASSCLIDHARGDDAGGRRVEVTVDTSDAPAAAAWAGKAKRLVEEWQPIIAAMLPSDGFVPPHKIRLIFKSNMKGVAYTSGDAITISADWIARHPDDAGMVIHELTHVIQSYHHGGPGWLVEGVADYVRFFRFEPQSKVRVDPLKASYRDSYRTTAAFLDWIVEHRDNNFVRELNQALRDGRYNETIFKTRTTKNVDELWAEFIASLSKSGAGRAPRNQRDTGHINNTLKTQIRRDAVVYSNFIAGPLGSV